VRDTPHSYRRLGTFDGDEDAIDDLIADRLVARAARDFEKADKYMAALKYVHGVFLSDTDRTWTSTPRP
jgi:cysteinyl-tRNA synthetase